MRLNTRAGTGLSQAPREFYLHLTIAILVTLLTKCEPSGRNRPALALQCSLREAAQRQLQYSKMRIPHGFAQVRRISWVRGVGRSGRGEWPPRTATVRPATFFCNDAIRHEKGALRRLLSGWPSGALLDLRFLEEDVLARLRIVFPKRELLRHRARVLLRHVEEARAFLADEADFYARGLGHRRCS